MYLYSVSPLYWYLVSRFFFRYSKTFWTHKLKQYHQFLHFLVCWIFSVRLKNLDSVIWPTIVPRNFGTNINLRCKGRATLGFLFVSAFQNICYLSQKKVSSLRNVSFSNAKENPPSKFLGFSIGINLDWNNIHIKAIKGAYNNQNSKFGVFNNWSSQRYSQNSDTLFPKIFGGSSSWWLIKLGVKCCFSWSILFSSKTPVLEKLDFLRLITTDFENLKAYL